MVKVPTYIYRRCVSLHEKLPQDLVVVVIVVVVSTHFNKSPLKS